jgi:CheY-like chemotaxis protein
MPSDQKDQYWPGTTILIAEDDEFSFQFFNVILKERGFEVIRAKNGTEALQLFREHDEIRLILMDIQLPEIDGYEVTRRIREDDPDIPIIAQTAYIHNEEEAKCIEAGCSAYLSKPIDLKKLFSIVGGFLD